MVANNFDPNDNSSSPWATYIPKRRPAFKVHNKQGTASGALSYHDQDGSAMYEWRNGRWELYAEVSKGDSCERCGKPPGKTRYGYAGRLSRSGYERRLRVWERTLLCSACSEEESSDPSKRRFGR